MDASYTKEVLENTQIHSMMKPYNRTLSLDLTIEPISDTSSTVFAINPVGSLLLWTVIEAMALGFITTAAFNSLRSYHSYPIFDHHIANIFYENPYEDIIDKKRKLTDSYDESKLSTIMIRSSEWTGDPKKVVKELQSYILKWFPAYCSKENVTFEISKETNNPT